MRRRCAPRCKTVARRARQGSPARKSAGQGVPRTEHRQSIVARCTSATRGHATRRSSCRRRHSCRQSAQSAFEKRAQGPLRLHRPSKQLVVEAVSVEAVGGGATLQRARAQDRRAASCPPPARRTRFFSGGKWHERRVFTRDAARARSTRSPAPPSSSSRTRPSSSRPAGRPSSPPRIISCSSASRRSRAPRAVGTQRRSGDAGSVQQPVHVDRRADGRGAAEHRLFGEHQGAARFLLRGVRRRRHAGRQRAAHAGAPRLDGPRGRDHHPREQGQDPPGRCLRASTRPTTAARICPTSRCARRCSTTRGEQILFWVASRGHHADVGGISPGSMSPNATTIEEEGVYIDNFKLVERGRFREEETRRAADRRQVSGAQSGAEHQRPEGADRRQRERRAGTAQDGRASSGCRSCRPTCATCRTTPPKACAASSTGCTTARSRYEMDQGTVDQGEDHASTRRSARRPSISPAPRRSSRPTSTRPSR